MLFETWEDVRPQPGKQTEFLKLVGKVDFMIVGGSRYSGKSVLSSMVPTMFCNDPNYGGISFRETYKDLKGSGSLWDYASNILPLFDARMIESKMEARWPSGASHQFSYLANDKDAQQHRGKGYSFMLFDEIDKFSKESVLFLQTCLRSNAEMNSFCIGTCNPSDSWVKDLIMWYLDEDGFPDPKKQGKIRYFVEKDGDFLFADDEDYFQKHHPETVTDGEGNFIPPKTFCFFFMSIEDNPEGKKKNPRYVTQLNSLPEWQKKRELYGNWFAVEPKESFFNRKYLRGEDGERVLTYADLPASYTSYRGWDKAHSPVSAKNKYPDYTAASPKIIVTEDQSKYILVGDYHPDVKDKEEREKHIPILGQFREDCTVRDDLMIKQALYDGLETAMVVTKDRGSGVSDHSYSVKKFVASGIQIIEDKLASQTKGKKIQDFLPFCNACKMGLVYIVEESFNSETLKNFYKQLEQFDGSKSGKKIHDDMVDAVSMTFDAAVRNENGFQFVSFKSKRSETFSSGRIRTRFSHT